MSDITDPKTWQSLEVGDIITLKDEQTKDLIEDKADRATEGKDLVIEEIEEINVQGADIKFLVFKFTDMSNHDKAPLTIITKIVGKKMDIRVYFQPDDFEPGDRQEQLDNDRGWLFNEPEDMGDFSPADLEMIDSLGTPGEGSEIIPFSKKGETFHAETRLDDNRMSFIQVTEWLAAEECKNPECIAIEYGGLDIEGNVLPQGGYLTFFQGETISNPTTDIDVLQAKSA